MSKGPADQMRSVLNDYKNDRIGLGIAMKRLKQILFATNENWFARGNVSGRYFTRKTEGGDNSPKGE